MHSPSAKMVQLFRVVELWGSDGSELFVISRQIAKIATPPCHAEWKMEDKFELNFTTQMMSQITAMTMRTCLRVLEFCTYVSCLLQVS